MKINDISKCRLEEIKYIYFILDCETVLKCKTFFILVHLKSEASRPGGSLYHVEFQSNK